MTRCEASLLEAINIWRDQTKYSLTSDCVVVCSTRFEEHTGDKGGATRPVARPRLWTKQGVFEVKADAQVNAIIA